MSKVPAVITFTALLWLITVILLPSSVSGHSRVLIVPPDSVSVCENRTDCGTLTNYILSDAQVFNKSDLRVEFRPGIHKVTLKANSITQLTISKVERISWYGKAEFETAITCESQITFIFINVVKLTISHLKFENCGHISNKKITISALATLYFNRVTDFLLSNTEIHHSRGYGLRAKNIRGSNTITSCTFVKNGISNKRLGGNVMFYFTKILENVSNSTVNTIIINSKFYSGKIRSVSQNGDMYPNPVIANELVIIANQTKYPVTVHVSNTHFFGNTGSQETPAVTVSDYSGIVNNSFTFLNCNFTQEGPIRLYQRDSTCAEKTLLCYSKLKKNKNNQYNILPLMTIERCIFSHGANTGINIMTSSTYVRYDKFRIISISECTFKNYTVKVQTHSVIHIRYKFDGPAGVNKKYPSVIIRISHSNFSFTTNIPSIVTELDPSTFSNAYIQKYSMKENSLLNIIDCKFQCNSGSVIVQIQTLPNNNAQGPIPIWKYEKTIDTEKNNKSIDIKKVLISKCTFSNNTSDNDQKIVAIQDTYITLDNSLFKYLNGTALYAERSVINLQGLNKFVENTGVFGGAMNLNKSRIYISPESYLQIINNTAQYGGGIFGIADLTPQQEIQVKKMDGYANRCTISQKIVGGEAHRNPITLEGNKSLMKNGGNDIYGGTYSKCRFNCTKGKCSDKRFPYHPPYIRNISKHHDVVCPPSRLYICRDKNYLTQTTMTIFPGQTLQIPIVAMDEFNGTRGAVVSGTICKDFTRGKCTMDYKNDIGYGQRLQEIATECTNVTYTVNSQLKLSIQVKIHYDETPYSEFEGNILIDAQYFQAHASNVTIDIALSECPVGYQLKESSRSGEPSGCKCLRYFDDHGVECNITTGKVIKPLKKWIFSGERNTLQLALPALLNKTIVHQNCPYDYCIQNEKEINLSTPNDQCNFNRSGILCGACQNNFSIVLGSSKCKECSNVYLLLLIPFALAGVALVVLLLKCNLTVAIGHINGIIFYANIVQVNKPLLFPYQNLAFEAFTTFMSWLNLDLGIETCFFENMDTYAKVWLQFVFPVYLWIIIGLIIILANYSSKLGQLIGKNSVPVLATLFLLSYAKLLRTIIAAVSHTYIVYDNGAFITVWRQDGNVEYLSPKHVVLFLVALLFALVYILPLTLLVLLAPHLQARSHHKALHWVNRLKPFLDAYQGPYTDGFRYWTGLLLVLRIMLFTAFGLNYENDPSLNFFCTIIAIFPIAMLCLVKRNIYKSKLANYLEIVSLLNIVVLCLVNWLTTLIIYPTWHPIREYATYCSVGVVMVTFLGIILYQLILKTCPGIFTKKSDGDIEEEVELTVKDGNDNFTTTSEAGIEESDKLREPLLET